MLQLPQTRPPILILSRTTERLRQAILLLRQHRTRIPNATPTSLQSKTQHESPHPHPSKIKPLFAELRPLWTHRARASE